MIPIILSTYHTNKIMNSPFVFTDLEPDDIIAIDILCKYAVPEYIVVGEGNVNIKKKRMERYLRLMKAGIPFLPDYRL